MWLLCFDKYRLTTTKRERETNTHIQTEKESIYLKFYKVRSDSSSTFRMCTNCKLLADPLLHQLFLDSSTCKSSSAVQSILSSYPINLSFTPPTDHFISLLILSPSSSSTSSLTLPIAAAATTNSF
uniref:Uncharacterized protein n=1 Tax=Octopus bimaculoides TaxID=37653 RepID=A0A0L8GGL7_OCTBM